MLAIVMTTSTPVLKGPVVEIAVQQALFDFPHHQGALRTGYLPNLLSLDADFQSLWWTASLYLGQQISMCKEDRLTQTSVDCHRAFEVYVVERAALPSALFFAV